MKKGMIKVTVFYPNSNGKTFDMDYYCNKHMLLVGTLAGDTLKNITVEKGHFSMSMTHSQVGTS